MQWGRVDADTCLDEPELPSPTMTSTEMFAYFQEEFGFSKTQVLEAVFLVMCDPPMNEL